MREWRRNNRERQAELARRWRAANPERDRANRQANKRSRKALERGAHGKHTARDIAQIFEQQRGRCAWCRARLKCGGPEKYHVDHIRPLSRGGSNARGNLCLACPSCNIAKGAQHPEAFARSLGLLL